MKLPANLKSAREAAGLSQVELAEKVEVAPSTVAGWETGAHGIRMARLTKVARALRTTVEKLVA